MINRKKIENEYSQNIAAIDNRMVAMRQHLDTLRSSSQELRYNKEIKNFLLKELNLTEILIKEIVELKLQGDQILKRLSQTDFVLPLIKRQ